MSASKIFAQALLLASQLRENSYDKEASDKASQAHQEKKKTSKFLLVNYKQFYRLSLIDAAEQACQQIEGAKGLGVPVYLMLMQTWNDAIGWAEEETK